MHCGHAQDVKGFARVLWCMIGTVEKTIHKKV
jgi:hypothetical protein